MSGQDPSLGLSELLDKVDLEKAPPMPWVVGEFDDCGGYDCMTAGVQIRSADQTVAVLDGYDFGQKPSHSMTPEDQARMLATAALIVRAVNAYDAMRDWRRIDDDAPGTRAVLLGWWQTWPKKEWVCEVAPYVLEGSGGAKSMHGQATHWMPLAPAPEGGE